MNTMNTKTSRRTSKLQELTPRERRILWEMVGNHFAALNKINPDCISPLIVIRNTVRPTAEKIGHTLLPTETQVTQEEWYKITEWIYDIFVRLHGHD